MIVISWLKKEWRTIAGLILLALFVVFIGREQSEFVQIENLLQHASWSYLFLALLVTVLYIVTQSLLLQECIRVVGKMIPLSAAIQLYLKRYFISTFIPTGYSLAQFTYSNALQKYNVSRLENRFASLLYLIVGVIDYTLLLIITVIWLFFHGDLTPFIEYTTLVLVFCVGGIIWALFNGLKQKGIVYRFFKRFLPDLSMFLDSWHQSFHHALFVPALVTAFVADLLGILTFWIAFQAFQIPASFFVAFAGHILTILIMTVSPLFQGIGLVEVSLLYILTQFGLDRPDAFTATLFYRFFQVWVPFLAGLVITVQKRIKSELLSMREVI